MTVTPALLETITEPVLGASQGEWAVLVDLSDLIDGGIEDFLDMIGDIVGFPLLEGTAYAVDRVRTRALETHSDTHIVLTIAGDAGVDLRDAADTAEIEG